MRLCCILAVLLVVGCQKSADDAATRREADMAAQPERASEARDLSKQDFSAIWIVVEPVCELLVTDAEGRRTGMDPVSGRPLQEIPNSAYFSEYIEDPEGEGGMESIQLEIRGPRTGEYDLAVVCAAAAEYNLGVRLYDAAGNSRDFDVEHVSIASGETHRYVLGFKRDAASECALTAGASGR